MDMKVTYKIPAKYHQIILSKVSPQSSNKEDALEQMRDCVYGKFEIVEIEELGEYGTYDYQKAYRSLRDVAGRTDRTSADWS